MAGEKCPNCGRRRPCRVCEPHKYLPPGRRRRLLAAVKMMKDKSDGK